jgi:hypothetical protein
LGVDLKSSGRLALTSLAAYYVVGSLVDLAAFNGNIVGIAAVPSAVLRIAVGVLCAVAALGERVLTATPQG